MSEKAQDEEQMSLPGLNKENNSGIQSSPSTTNENGIQLNPIHSTNPVKINSSRSESPVEQATGISQRTSLSKTEAEIEYQKDQPLYKRQLSKSLDNSASAINRMKQIQESNSR